MEVTVKPKEIANMKLAVTRLFSKSYKKTHPQKKSSKENTGTSKRSCIFIALGNRLFETSEDILGNEQETPNSLLLHK